MVTNVVAALLLVGCASSGGSDDFDSNVPGEAGNDILVVVINESGQRFELSYAFGRTTPRRVGSIRSGEELEVRVQARPGDLRFILGDSGVRTVTSNPAPNPRAGETYRLLISSTRGPELRLMTERR
jgi:hypothetical protein